MRLSIIICLLISFSVSAKLLDKISAIFDNEIFTFSQIERIQSNIPARKNIAPMIYFKEKMSEKEIIDILINRNLMREKLSELGYVISDDQVEAQIKDTEQRLKLTRKALLDFLQSNNMTFEEYFELIRESIEANIFNSRVISPLISITDQEIKNAFYRENSNNNALAFKYTLIDYSLEKSLMNKMMLTDFKNVISTYQSSGNLPKNFDKLETNVLGDILENGLATELVKILKQTDEGALTEPIVINGAYHLFFVKKKDLVESDVFMNEKERIKNQLYEKTSKDITDAWFERERDRHYIKLFNS